MTVTYIQLKDNMVEAFINNLFSGKPIDESLDYMFMSIWAWGYDQYKNNNRKYQAYGDMTEEEIKLEFKLGFLDVLSGKDNIARLIRKTVDYILSYTIQKLNGTVGNHK